MAAKKYFQDSSMEITKEDLKLLNRKDFLYIKGLLKLRRFKINPSDFHKSEKKILNDIDTKIDLVLRRDEIV